MQPVTEQAIKTTFLTLCQDHRQACLQGLAGQGRAAALLRASVALEEAYPELVHQVFIEHGLTIQE